MLTGDTTKIELEFGNGGFEERGKQNRGYLPFTQKIRKFRLECKWEDLFPFPKRKISGENGGSPKFPNGQ